MKIGSKGYYGLLALAELAASYSSRRALQVKEIAKNQNIPTEYLGQIMVLLKRAGLVHGSRGPAGGYTLARPPELITIRDALRALEGPSLTIDISGQKSGLSPACQKVVEIWARGLRAMEQVLEESTIADLCRAKPDAYMFYI
ncbi:MAG TPA: Rrf2 family transcriptional regulator [candidate division Zixibacteria bacterium]|nr:Rrf2 family transcriptional regulator [candidate division Zixibacteria bacterium]